MMIERQVKNGQKTYTDEELLEHARQAVADSQAAKEREEAHQRAQQLQYFAAAALTGMLAGLPHEERISSLSGFANEAWAMAGAMVDCQPKQPEPSAEGA